MRGCGTAQVNFAYPNSPLLKASTQNQPGERVGSRFRQSTPLGLLLDLYEPAQGRCVDGIGRADGALSLRRQVGYVPRM